MSHSGWNGPLGAPCLCDMSLHPSFAVPAAFLPGLAWACSGPGAADLIARAELTVLGGMALSVALCVVGAVRRRRRTVSWLRALAGVLVVPLYPFFFVSARMGDCGRTATAAAVAVMVISLTWAVWPVKAPPAPVG